MKFCRSTRFDLLCLPLLIAAGFSAFIYFEHFGLTSRLLNTVLATAAIYGMLSAPKRTLPIAGFWIGLLWCYWIGLSFQYYDLGWAVGLVAIGFGFVYALFFGVMGLTSQPILRALLFFALSYVWPMDFNWMQPELVYVESYLGFEKWQFALILAALSLAATLRGPKRFAPLLLLTAAVQLPYAPPPLPDLKIKLVSTEIPQDLKWQYSELDNTVRFDLEAIERAADEGYDLVVLPESAFPLYMNHQPELLAVLEELSYRIPILTGTLLEEDQRHYNVTYLFDQGNVTIAKKTILVPFGEYIPLPGFLHRWINREIFGGGSDFMTADKPTDFTIKGTRFRNAICYEATRQELYTPDVRYLIATSNNGWFKPSIEPTLQKLLIRFYARQNRTVVFHAANGGGSGIVY